MPPKTKGRRSAKPTLKKAKAMVTKNRKAKAKINMDTFYLKTKQLYDITPVQGTTVANYLYTSSAIAPSGNNSYVTNAEFNLYKLQFDRFRVNSVTVKIIPKANVLDQAQATNDSALTLSGDGSIHTCIDRDGTAPPNIAAISRYPSYKKYSLNKPFSRTYRIKYPIGVWMDTNNPNGFEMQRSLGQWGGITLYAENLVEDIGEIFNEPFASMEVSHDIVFQGKTQGSLTGVYDASGNLTGVTVSARDETIEKAQIVPTSVRGTLDGDRRYVGGGVSVPITDRGDA